MSGKTAEGQEETLKKKKEQYFTRFGHYPRGCYANSVRWIASQLNDAGSESSDDDSWSESDSGSGSFLRSESGYRSGGGGKNGKNKRRRKSGSGGKDRDRDRKRSKGRRGHGGGGRGESGAVDSGVGGDGGERGSGAAVAQSAGRGGSGGEDAQRRQSCAAGDAAIEEVVQSHTSVIDLTNLEEEAKKAVDEGRKAVAVIEEEVKELEAQKKRLDDRKKKVLERKKKVLEAQKALEDKAAHQAALLSEARADEKYNKQAADELADSHARFAAAKLNTFRTEAAVREGMKVDPWLRYAVLCRRDEAYKIWDESDQVAVASRKKKLFEFARDMTGEDIAILVAFAVKGYALLPLAEKPRELIDNLRGELVTTRRNNNDKWERINFFANARKERKRKQRELASGVDADADNRVQAKDGILDVAPKNGQNFVNAVNESLPFGFEMLAKGETKMVGVLEGGGTNQPLHTDTGEDKQAKYIKAVAESTPSVVTTGLAQIIIPTNKSGRKLRIVEGAEFGKAGVRAARAYTTFPNIYFPQIKHSGEMKEVHIPFGHIVLIDAGALHAGMKNEFLGDELAIAVHCHLVHKNINENVKNRYTKKTIYNNVEKFRMEGGKWAWKV